MNTLYRGIVLAVGVLGGLALGGGKALANPPVVVSSYYAPPVVAYEAPVSVTTTRYGVFGLRRATTVTYGSPVPVVSSYYAPPVAVVSSYYAPPVVRAYYAPVVSSYYAPPVVRTYYAPSVLVPYP